MDRQQQPEQNDDILRQDAGYIPDRLSEGKQSSGLVPDSSRKLQANQNRDQLIPGIIPPGRSSDKLHDGHDRGNYPPMQHEPEQSGNRQAKVEEERADFTRSEEQQDAETIAEQVHGTKDTASIPKNYTPQRVRSSRGRKKRDTPHIVDEGAAGVGGVGSTGGSGGSDHPQSGGGTGGSGPDRGAGTDSTSSG
jgi:hypothetical protein